MKTWVSNLGVGIVAGWTVFAIALWWLAPDMATYAGLTAGLAAGWLFRASIVVRGLVAVLEPIGIVLPLLALRHVASTLGYNLVPFTFIELVVFLVAYVGFLAASMGAIGLDPYRFGYRPWPVAAVALGLCGLGLVTGNIFYPIVAVTGQVMWVLRLGSSNYFDHILHAVLVPVVLIELVSRVF